MFWGYDHERIVVSIATAFKNSSREALAHYMPLVLGRLPPSLTDSCIVAIHSQCGNLGLDGVICGFAAVVSKAPQHHEPQRPSKLRPKRPCML